MIIGIVVKLEQWKRTILKYKYSYHSTERWLFFSFQLHFFPLVFSSLFDSLFSVWFSSVKVASYLLCECMGFCMCDRVFLLKQLSVSMHKPIPMRMFTENSTEKGKCVFEKTMDTISVLVFFSFAVLFSIIMVGVRCSANVFNLCFFFSTVSFSHIFVQLFFYLFYCVCTRFWLSIPLSEVSVARLQKNVLCNRRACEWVSSRIAKPSERRDYSFIHPSIHSVFMSSINTYVLF